MAILLSSTFLYLWVAPFPIEPFLRLIPNAFNNGQIPGEVKGKPNGWTASANAYLKNDMLDKGYAVAYKDKAAQSCPTFPFSA